MLARPRRSLFRGGAALAALAVFLLAAPHSRAQEPTAVAANGPSPAAGGARTAAVTRRAPGQPGESSFTDTSIPGFGLDATVNLGETYTTNAGGFAGGGQSDFLTFGGIDVNMHEHSRRVSLDATYSGQVYFYDQGTQSTQFTNNLQAVGNVIAIPEYVNFKASAFAQPVVLSNVGIVTANGTVSPNGYRNSYGYSAG